MANVKFSGLPTASAIAATDLFAISQNVPTTPVSNKIAFSNLIDDTAYTSAWNGDIKGASKNSIYDQLHKIDTADDGSIISASTGFRIGGAAASGKILIGNGTNFIASTPTYPNASATAGKLLVSDGTNFVASTPTYPNAASPTSGKLLQADGTNWVASTMTWPSGTAPASGKVMISDGTNMVASTPTFPNASATALKHIRSDGTNWIASTATISDTPGTAGKVLISDGTNWITSTPTFPNASATARKFITSDGTNWVASTETQAAPGNASNLLVSDGTNWISKLLQVIGSNTAQQSISTSDVYITGSAITITAGTWVVGMIYRLLLQVTKSAGTGTVVLSLRIGTLGTTGDAAVVTASLVGAGTSVTDTGIFEWYGIVRAIGASATMMTLLKAVKLLTTTGIANTGGQVIVGSASLSSTWNANTATKIGVSFNGSTAFAGTCDLVQAELISP